MRIAFEYQSPDAMFYFEIVIDICFMVDLVLNFNTGANIKGKIYMDRVSIAKDYLSGWFWIDLLSSTPYTWILAWSQGLTIEQVERDAPVPGEEKAISGAVASAP